MSAGSRAFPRRTVIKIEEEDKWPADAIFSADNQRVSREEMVKSKQDFIQGIDFSSMKDKKFISLQATIACIGALLSYYFITTTTVRRDCSDPNNCYLVYEVSRQISLLILGIVFGLLGFLLYCYVWKIRRDYFKVIRPRIAQLNEEIWKSRGLEWSLSVWSSTITLRKCKVTQPRADQPSVNSQNLEEPLASS
eukprot:TRINITY_DN6784_c0_g2_i6.p1 TRINITY_DN6784_c0_g2~~TRINITY_DN6784_c0_g2_i6.p1  ORF type:complete len:194 (+),score=19.59 TRINITY_DN6784_c0_g2_i6:121-702(+)